MSYYPITDRPIISAAPPSRVPASLAASVSQVQAAGRPHSITQPGSTIGAGQSCFNEDKKMNESITIGPDITDEQYDKALEDLILTRCLRGDVEWFMSLPGFYDKAADFLNDEVIERALEMGRGEE